MAVSLNAVVGFNSTTKFQDVRRIRVGASVLKTTYFASPSRMFGSTRPINIKIGRPCLLVVNVDRLATETSDKGSEKAEVSSSGDQSLTSSKTETGDQTLEAPNGSIVSSDPEQDTAYSDLKSTPKRSRLTAREKLRAARVLSRYSESKPSKTELGSKVLAVLRESDKGKKRSGRGLPEAPTNLFDDSKRGMPKKGLTFELPVGWDVFLIITSVVLISTIMFTTTYIVWKVGAIHFNEY